MSTTKPCGLKCKQLIGIYLVSLSLHGTNCYSFQRARFWWHQHLRGGLFMGSKPIIPGCSISNGGDFRHTLFLGVQYTGIVVEGKHLHWYYSYCTQQSSYTETQMEFVTYIQELRLKMTHFHTIVILCTLCSILATLTLLRMFQLIH